MQMTQAERPPDTSTKHHMNWDSARIAALTHQNKGSGVRGQSHCQQLQQVRMAQLAAWKEGGREGRRREGEEKERERKEETVAATVSHGSCIQTNKALLFSSHTHSHVFWGLIWDALSAGANLCPHRQIS